MNDGGLLQLGNDVLSLLTSYTGYSFVGWYTSLAAAKDLLAEGSFDLTTPITSDLSLYAGYSEDKYPAAVNTFLRSFLGVYETLSLSPLPFLKADSYEVSASGFIAKGVKQENLASFVSSLLSSSFVLRNGTYHDKHGAYRVLLEGEDTSNVTVSLSFNDELGAFPVHFLSAISPALDLAAYMSDDEFMLAKNTKDEPLSRRFITSSYYGRGLIGGTINESRTIYYTPKDEDEAPVESFGDYLTANGFQAASSDGTYFIDSFAQILVKVTLAGSDITSAETDLGVASGMVRAQFSKDYSSSFDETSFAEAFKSYTTYDFVSDAFPSLSGLGKAYGMLLRYSISSGSYYGPGLYITGASKTSFEALLAGFSSLGYGFSKTTSTYKTSFVFTSSEGAYRVSLAYFDSSLVGGLLSDIISISVFRVVTPFEAIGAWFRLQNVGGGTLLSIPSFKASSFSFSTLNSYPYAYSISATKVAVSEKDAFIASLLAAGWTKNTEASTAYAIYDYSDGFYEMAISYGEDLSFRLVVTYKCSSEVTSSSAFLALALKRLQVETLSLTKLDPYFASEGAEAVKVYQFFDGSNNRVVAYFPMGDASLATNEVSAWKEALAKEDSGWTYLSSNSSGVSFYSNSDEVYLGITSYADSASKNYLLLILYK